MLQLKSLPIVVSFSTLQLDYLRIIARQQDIERLKETIAASVTSKSEDEEDLKAVINEKNDFANKQKSFFDTREELSKKSAELDKEVYRLNTQKEKLLDNQQGLVSYMFS
ncbi:MAG: hypothetical protein HUK02_09965, partial [Bacteroidaceae bacterium]|nr:hypothetical protein [Bacteroidaceae bacterium]